jgi:hypothetical protein
MKHAERHVESLAESLDELRREADLWHEDQRALAAGERTLDYLKIDLGLAAAGDSVEDECAEAPQ